MPKFGSNRQKKIAPAKDRWGAFEQAKAARLKAEREAKLKAEKEAAAKAKKEAAAAKAEKTKAEG